MLKIEKIDLINADEKSRIVGTIYENEIKKEVFFEVSNEYAQYLCYERCDAFVIGCLNYAMRNNLNIVSNVPITEELLYNINYHLIPALVRNDNNLYLITIEAPIAESLNNAGAIGTGLSCGIDSFHSIIMNTDTKYPNRNITHVCINNVGAFNSCYKKSGIEKVKKDCYERARKVAKELGLPLIETNSNFAEKFEQSHLYTNTYSSVFAVYCLQKLWKLYYYAAAGYGYEYFSLKNNSLNDSAVYDLLSLNCFSKDNLRLYSEGGAINRLEKTKDIMNNEIVQNNLHVCTFDSKNCNVCSKCRRTILSLYALDVLSKYKKVFDIKYFELHKKEYLLWLYERYLSDDHMLLPIYNQLKNEIGLTLKTNFWVHKFFSIKNEYRNNAKHKIITFFGIKMKFKVKNKPQTRARVERERERERERE